MKKAWMGLAAALCCAVLCSAAAGEGRERKAPRYHYVSLDQALPPEFLFFAAPMKVTLQRRVYLNAWACPELYCVPSIVMVHHGVGRTLHRNARLFDANEHGLIGGSLVTDPENFVEQAALFKDHAVRLLPRMQGEVTSQVLRVTDSGLALVAWQDESFAQHYYLYDHGKVTPVTAGDAAIGVADVNRHGIVAGTIGAGSHQRAFRLNPYSHRLTLLEPQPTEPAAWGLGINDRGDVLGYSFVYGGRERIGVWRGTRFITWFVEGTPQFPTISNNLLWNERGEIVITRTSSGGGDPNSYLVPRPGVRLKLADISDQLPFVWTGIADINERGDMVGEGGPDFFDVEGTFLLEHIDVDGADGHPPG